MKSKAAKLGGRIERELLRAQRAALEDLRNKQADPAYEAEKWEDRSTRTVINMKFAEQAAAMVRATKAADAGPRMLGFVVGVNLIPDPAKWEEAAKAVEAGKQVIEVEASVPALVRSTEDGGEK